MAGGFLFAFFWAVKDGQYDDAYTPSMRLLVDDDMLMPLTDEMGDNQNNYSAISNKENHDTNTDI